MGHDALWYMDLTDCSGHISLYLIRLLFFLNNDDIALVHLLRTVGRIVSWQCVWCIFSRCTSSSVSHVTIRLDHRIMYIESGCCQWCTDHHSCLMQIKYWLSIGSSVIVTFNWYGLWIQCDYAMSACSNGRGDFIASDHNTVLEVAERDSVTLIRRASRSIKQLRCCWLV